MLAVPELLLLRILVLLFSFVCLSGCYQSNTPLRVGTNLWPGYELLYLARERGYYDAQIKLVELPSASDVIDALRLGQLDAGALTLDELLTLMQEGHDLVVVLVFNISMGADRLLARPGIDTLEALRGRTIALETTAVGALMLQGALTRGGLQLHDVTLRHLDLHDHLRAYRRGEIDAMITFEPHATALLTAGAVPLFSSADIPGQIVDVLAVRRSVLRKHDHNLRHLLQGFFRAREDLLQTPEAALAIINQRMKIPATDLPHLFDGLQLPDVQTNTGLLQGDPAPLTRTATQLAELMQEQLLLPATPALSSFTSPRWLPETP